jgi:hypothetical protein
MHTLSSFDLLARPDSFELFKRTHALTDHPIGAAYLADMVILSAFFFHIVLVFNPFDATDFLMKCVGYYFFKNLPVL